MLPPEDIPNDLSAREYRRLGIQYFLMGHDEKASDAFALGYILETPRAEDALAKKRKASNDNGANTNSNLSKTVTRLIREYSKPDNEADQAVGEVEELVETLRDSLRDLGLQDEKIDCYVEELMESIRLAHSCDNAPPRVVPTDLTPREFYELGVQYKQLGWTEQARDALTYAIDGEPDGPWGHRSRHYLQARLPLHPVPLMAEQKNISGYNQLALGDHEGARDTFRELISQYPDFEWPYGNLGYLHLREGNLKEANRILRDALSINPNYLNGWLHLARVTALQDDFRKARECIRRAVEILPDDRDVQNIARFIDELENI